ncbi:MAG TPA: alpha/beta hydrolase [Longimicrobium sp.]|nr:alpha/beta hydrolase [Longimicrobium sp.]
MSLQDLKATPARTRTEPAAFTVSGVPLAGDLHLPVGHRPGERLPAVLVGGSWTTVRQQMATVYARRLAERGFAALAFDYRHYGGSGGEPRQYESHEHKIDDLRGAAAWLAANPAVDAERVGGLAVCASAGYMAHAVAAGAPLRAWATVAAWMHDPSTVGLFYGGDGGVERRVALGRAAREKWERTGVADYAPAYNPENPDAAMFFPIDYYARPERGAVPEWENRFAVMGWEPWLAFDALAPAESIRIPTLQVHSDGCALPDNVRRFQRALAGPKELVWMEDGEQTDFYDLDPFVSRATEVVDAFFREMLSVRGTP